MARMTVAARQALVEERRSQILNAAIRVFARKGYATATIHNIAAAAGVAEGTIYNYFRSKEDLLIHIPRHIAGPAFERLALELPEVHSVEEAEQALVTLGSEMVRRVAANARFVKVFLSAIPHLSPRARREYLRLLPLAAADVVEAHVRQGIAAGLYRPDLDPAIVARTLPFMMFMLVIIQEVLSGSRIWRQGYDVMVRENVRLFLTGIQNPKPPWTGHADGGSVGEAR
jgi:TetR/AcrR family fatty acid metabolism transcriptional regulator